MKFLSYHEFREVVETINASGEKRRVWFHPGVNDIPDGYDLSENEKQRWNGKFHRIEDNGTVSPLVPKAEPTPLKTHTMPQQPKGSGGGNKDNS